MAVYKLAFGGDLYDDVWECGLHLGATTGGSADAYLDDFTNDIKTWMDAAGVISAATLKYVKLNEISATTRRYVDQSNSYERVGTPIYATSYGAQVLPQLTLCVSLGTGIKRGPAAHGRFYPPPISYIGSGLVSGRVSPSNVTSYLNACKAFIDNLNNQPGIDGANSFTVVVLGKGGVQRNVETVSVGDVVDTQRRRRNALVEKRQSATVQ